MKKVIIDDCDPVWIEASVQVPDDKDTYEVTVISDDSVFFRDFAYYDSRCGEWRSHLYGSLLNVVAWRPHAELFGLPFN